MSNAFAPIVRARPNPIFGRPVDQGLPHSITARYFSSNPSDSGSLRTPCPPASKPAGQRGITPVFGYSAPHPSAGRTLTLLIHALPSAHCAPVRLPSDPPPQATVKLRPSTGRVSPVTRITFPTCRAHYPGGSNGCICRLLPHPYSLPRFAGGSASASLLSRSHGEVDSDRRSGRVGLRSPTLETAMRIIADQPEAPSAIRSDLGAIFISLELSRSTWLITSLSPGGGEKMSKHSVPAGDICVLLARFSEITVDRRRLRGLGNRSRLSSFRKRGWTASGFTVCCRMKGSKAMSSIRPRLQHHVGAGERNRQDRRRGAASRAAGVQAR